jgi:tetraacyldisaccharide 4'-kinase
LDDAYQHRQIKPLCNILLTDYHRPFYHDWLLPAGNLREARKNAGRADVVIVTKCPLKLSNSKYESMESAIKKYTRKDISVFFTNIHYDEPIPAFNKRLSIKKNIILVSGIAQPKPLLKYIQHRFQLTQHFVFPDHHYFTARDMRKIIECYRDCEKETSILFTEKDVTRIFRTNLQDILMDYPVFFQPITYKFAQNGSEFDEFIRKVIDKKED